MVRADSTVQILKMKLGIQYPTVYNRELGTNSFYLFIYIYYEIHKYYLCIIH